MASLYAMLGSGWLSPSLAQNGLVVIDADACREEVLAYTEAVQRIRHGELYCAHLQHTGDLPAPELDSRRPTDRVHHYMQKLHKYILAEPQLRLKYDTAALTIQSMFKRYKWQQAIRSVRQKVSHVEVQVAVAGELAELLIQC